MKTIQYKIILSFIVLFNFSTYAQERYDVTMHDDTVYNHGVAQFIYKFRGSANGDYCSLRNLDNVTQAMLILMPDNNKIKFSGTFPFLQVKYACVYPKMEIITLLDSYIRNKVFVNGNANRDGLKAYCKERDLVLDTLVSHAVQSPATRDSTLAARAKEDIMNQVKFIFHNNAAKPVRIFIGNKPKGGSGRVQVIPPHGDLKEQARKTEKIFLINDAGDEIQSIPVKDSIKRVVIKASGDGFE